MPACANEPIGASSSPARFLEIAPVGNTRTLRHLRRSILDPGNRARTVSHRRSVRHANHRRESARRSGARTGLDRLLPAKAGLAEMDVNIDQTGTHDETGRVNLVDSDSISQRPNRFGFPIARRSGHR